MTTTTQGAASGGLVRLADPTEGSGTVGLVKACCRTISTTVVGRLEKRRLRPRRPPAGLMAAVGAPAGLVETVSLSDAVMCGGFHMRELRQSRRSKAGGASSV